MSNELIGEKLRKLREENKLPLRKVAALLDMDIAILSKMERGERRLTKEIVQKLAKIYKHDEKELLILYLSEKVLYEIGDEDLALKALHVAEEQVKYQASSKVNHSSLMKQIISTLKTFKPVSKAWIFGSFARGQEDYKSDIDLLIETTKSATFSYFDLFEIQHQLETKTRRKIDIGFYDSVKPGPWERIKKEIKLIYER